VSSPQKPATLGGCQNNKTPVASLCFEAENRTILPKEFQKSALLVIIYSKEWVVRESPTIPYLVFQEKHWLTNIETFEKLFLKKNHEKLSPHLNIGIFLRFFEPIWVPPIWREYFHRATMGLERGV